jgi:hypothetical protein
MSKSDDTTKRPTCKTCPYWHDLVTEDEGIENWKDDEVRFGDCRRRAPSPVMIYQMPPNPGSDNRADLVWLQTLNGDWCGEHPDFPAYIASLKKPRTVPEMEAEILATQNEIETAVGESMTEFGMTAPKGFNSPIKEH